MNSGLMNFHHNYLENFIDDPEYFFQYHSWLLSGYEGNTLKTNTTQVITTQVDVGSNYHIFSDITMLTYTRPLKFRIQILNGRKSPEKGFGLVVVKIPEKYVIIPLWASYYMPQNPQNTMSQNALKH